MTHTPHSLADEFPEFTDLMHTLKTTDAHFAKLQADYEAANAAVHLAETDVAPTSDAHMTDLRKRRMLLKDEVFAHLTKASAR